MLNKCVLYRSLFTATLTDGGVPAPGKAIVLQSSRNVSGATPDTLVQPLTPTDSMGVTEGRVETRKSGSASISAQNYKTPQPASITLDEATYESVFLITTYYTPKETDFSPKPTMSNPCGLTGTYRTKFLSTVKLEGSGVAANGTTIQYYNGCYHTDTCPRTASGVCAQVGVTAAVDPAIVPMKSDFNITGIGIRTAQDTGGAIDGYHIDDYVGVGIANYFGDSYNRAVRLLGGDPSCAN